MDIVSVINNIVAVVYISLTVASFVVVLLHFFKKKTILTSLRMYENGLSSFAIVPFFLFGLLSIFSIYAIEPNFLYGYSLGVAFTVFVGAIVVIAILVESIMKWQSNLPNT